MKATANLLAAFWLVAATTSSPGQSHESRSPSGIISHIRRERVDSSAIAAIGYSKRLHALEIEFINGAVYRYLEVPASVHRQLMASPSKARFYDRNIRGQYRSVHVKLHK